MAAAAPCVELCGGGDTPDSLSTAAEQAQTRQLMEQYHDTPMDLADASLVATAALLNLRRIFTLDSDFYVYRINNAGVFEVVP